jgi:ankyrin repeat protein
MLLSLLIVCVVLNGDAIAKPELSNPADTDTKAETQDTALHTACRNGSVEIIKSILNESPGLVDVPGRFGQSCLFASASAGHVDVVKFLVSIGADVAAVDPFGYTALDGEACVQ